jgi:hypothetical protein
MREKSKEETFLQPKTCLNPGNTENRVYPINSPAFSRALLRERSFGSGE